MSLKVLPAILFRAIRYSKLDINPNDDVNMSQSSNDVIPTAIKLSAIMDLDGKLFPALDELIDSIEKKAKSLEGVIKTGRTHLMDAMPIDFSEELGAWASQLSASKEMLRTIEKRMVYASDLKDMPDAAGDFFFTLFPQRKKNVFFLRRKKK